MGFIEAIILGLVQGLTEFLPISSSAHLRIMGEFLPSASDPGATFTAITQLGTELAVILYFRKDIARILTRWFQQFRGAHGAHGEVVDKNHPDVRLGWLVILGTIPIVLVGYFAQEYISSTFRSLWLVATVLIVFGIILGIAMLYGAAARGAFALGYTRPAAARFGFLLAIPAVFGSGLYELVHSFGEPNQVFTYAETAVATVIAFVVGYVVIAALMRYIEKRSFLPFVIYRVVLGVVLFVLLSTNVIQPV